MSITPATPGQPVLAVLLSGDAIAAGDNTSATGLATNTATQLGNTAIAFGQAMFTAAASSSNNDAQASADSLLGVTGASFLFEATANGETGTGATSEAMSTTVFVAIHSPSVPGLLGVGQGSVTVPLDGHVNLPDGNFASNAATGEILGPSNSTFAVFSADSVAVGHQLSAVTTFTLLGV